MLAHYFTLEALAAEFRKDIAGATIPEAYTQSKDELVFTLRLPDGSLRSLFVGVAAGMNALFSREGGFRAKKNSTDIFPEIFGAQVTGLRVEPFSRVVTVDAGGLSVKAHLFNNASANVFLVGADGIVVSAFKGAADFRGKPYAVARRDAGVADPGDTVRVREALAGSAGPPDEAVKALFPWLGPLYRRELFFRAGVDGTAPAGGGDENRAEGAAREIISAISEMLGELRDPRPSLYATPASGREILSAIALRHLAGQPARPVPTVNEGVRGLVSGLRRDAGIDEEKSELLGATLREKKKVERSLKEALARADDDSAASRHRETGTLILTHLHRIRKGETEVTLPDGAGAEVRIRMDRALTPAGNANAYFERARKAETATEENRARIGILREKLAELESLEGELSECDDVRELRAIRKRLQPGRGAPVELRGGERLPYRVFPIGTQYEAWVGKSSADNDTLTFKHAGQHDYWMHVRGASGSHVILRSVSGGRFDPPKEALRAAARLAAYYSKMKKAGMVPVAYCERKYVKKPKNAPPGTVTLQREEVIFVEPALP